MRRTASGPARRTVGCRSWSPRSALFLLGFVALFSIGLPLLLSAALCVVAALRTPTRDWRDTV